MPARFDSLEERLNSCSSWVQQTFRKLETLCRESGGEVTADDEAKCEGRLFRVNGSRAAFCRIDPKLERIGIGFSNRIRHLVAQTGRLRSQKGMAWITLLADDGGANQYGEIRGEIGGLIRQANKTIGSQLGAKSVESKLGGYGFIYFASLQWTSTGEHFRLQGKIDNWKATRNFIYAWVDKGTHRILNVGHTGQAFRSRFGSYVQWLNGKRKNDSDTPIRRAWLACLSECRTGQVEVWIRRSAIDTASREAEERKWISLLRPVLNRR